METVKAAYAGAAAKTWKAVSPEYPAALRRVRLAP
jgi:hypothetical protein